MSVYLRLTKFCISQLFVYTYSSFDKSFILKDGERSHWLKYKEMTTTKRQRYQM